MADQGGSMDVQLLKRTRISVFVDEALPDILVVSYEYGVKIFKGVLLDSTKRNLPCGVAALHPAFNVSATKTSPDDDVLYSVNQRYAYMDPNNSKKKNVQITKYKNSKMTVRLRPRQVLCSKCKGICNENSENVSKKRKSTESVHSAPPIKRGANAPITRSVYSELNNKKKDRNLELKASLIPKISRLMPQEISNALSGNVNKLNIIDSNLNKKPLAAVSNMNLKCGSTINSDVDTENQDLEVINDQSSHSTDHSQISSIVDNKQGQKNELSSIHKISEMPGKSVKRVLRKKRSIGSMEDLWDESVFEENANNKNNNINEQNSLNTDNALNINNVCLSTRTIKISYGPQGEGTVLKIPAQIENLNASDDSEENVNIDEQKSKNKDANNKAARRALKRAKKEARRKILLSGNSPCYIGSGSPRYLVGGTSPRYTVGSASPRHGLGNNSPRYVAVSPYEINAPRRRKHKMKHKKKHREDKDRKHKEGEVNSTQEDSTKEQCLTQKLSINLRRLNNTYTSCQSNTDKVEENLSSSDEHSEQVPDFPPPNPPLMLHLNSQTVSSAQGADGKKLLVGDVIWGKIHGFPWWPGKILTMTNVGNQGPQAHVAWYGSSTSSLMQCDQLSPYLDNFKVIGIRYNKKKRGPYKEAIKQATTEARQNAESKLRETLVGSSPARSIITVVPPALASPREIDVVS